MASLKETKGAIADDEKRRQNLDHALPFDEREQQRKWQEHQKHCEQMAERQRPECHKQGSRTSFHQPCGDRERPPHSRIESVIEAARDNGEPKPGRCRPRSAQFQTDG